MTFSLRGADLPHVLINHARVHDMHLDIMRISPTRLVPDYEQKLLDLKTDPEADDYPVTVTIEGSDGTNRATGSGHRI